jgi:hypothetical protein
MEKKEVSECCLLGSEWLFLVKWDEGDSWLGHECPAVSMLVLGLGLL